MVAASTYQEACKIGRNIDGKALSKQAWAITPKIYEVDASLKNETERRRVFEIHPEISFTIKARSPLEYSKKKPQGYSERAKLIAEIFDLSQERLSPAALGLKCEKDDILDASIALWSAERIAAGTAQKIPEIDEKDSVDLAMCIWA